MRVRVLFFGVLKDLVGRAEDSLNLAEHATLADVLRHYESQVPKLGPMASSLAMSINHEYAAPNQGLKEGDEIGLLPPVSGGADPNTTLKHVEIVRDKIDTPRFLEKIKNPADGAVAVFDGIVRNNSRGRRTLYLDYETYEEMALRQMQGLVADALARFQVRDVILVHRIGRLEIGDTSVLIVVASAHRAAAFDACRWLIDTLKRTVPIWKKEHFEDGAVWADGEPFPPEIGKAQSSHTKKEASN